MWVISDEEMVKLQNRVNDLWEQSAEPDAIQDYIKCVNRMLGSLDMLMSADHYIKGSDVINWLKGELK